MLETAARTAAALLASAVFAGGAEAQGPTLVVDGASRGGACSDSRDVTQVSAGTPLCTLARAVELAPAGSTVLIRGGEYPNLLIEDKGYAARTTFKPYSPSEPVTLRGGVNLTRTTNLRVEGLRVAGLFTKQNQSLQIVGNEVSPGNIESYANVDVLIEGNYVHDVPAYPATKPEGYGIVLYTFDGQQNIRPVVRGNRVERTAADPYHSVSSIDLLFERNVALDALPVPGSGTHVDAFHVQGGRNLTIRLNRFDNTAHGMQFTTKDPQGVVIENNLMTNVRFGLGLSGAVGPGAKILSNTILSKLGMHLADEEADTTSELANVVILNNIFDSRGAMGANPTEDYNLWIRRQYGKNYGPHDAFGQPQFDPDYRLLPGSPGYRAGLNGQDMGANIDLFGPPPAPPPVPPAAPKRKKGVKGLRLVARCVRGFLTLRLKGKRVRRLSAVRFSIDGWALRPDGRRPFKRAVRVTAPTRVRVVARLKKAKRRPLVLVSLVPGCSRPR